MKHIVFAIAFFLVNSTLTFAATDLHYNPFRKYNCRVLRVDEFNHLYDHVVPTLLARKEWYSNDCHIKILAPNYKKSGIGIARLFTSHHPDIVCNIMPRNTVCGFM